MIRDILLASLTVCILLVVGCTRATPTARRVNVLLVTVDTLRADRLGCYGFGLARTPARGRGRRRTSGRAAE